MQEILDGSSSLTVDVELERLVEQWFVARGDMVDGSTNIAESTVQTEGLASLLFFGGHAMDMLIGCCPSFLPVGPNEPKESIGPALVQV